MIIWITGLSGAGKTTLARALAPMLPGPRLVLDGDGMREALAPVASGYSAEERRNLALTYSRLCKLIAEQDTHVVCATISMFHAVRDWNRRNLPGYFEVYLETPGRIRLERDGKGVYGEKDVVGVDIAPELPASPDMTITGFDKTAEETAEEVFARLKALL